jgi:hypothetical protein
MQTALHVVKVIHTLAWAIFAGCCLSLWLARNDKLIFGWLFAVVLVFALALWLESISFGA